MSLTNRDLTTLQRLDPIKWQRTEYDPAVFLANVMVSDEVDTDLRVKAALALMPFVHKKRPVAIEHFDAPPILGLRREVIDHANH